MASQHGQDPQELPDVVSAVLTPWDDLFLVELAPQTDEDVRNRQLGEITYSQYNANSDRLIRQAVEYLGPKIRPNRQEGSKPSNEDSNVDDRDDGDDLLAWMKAEHRKARAKWEKTPSERATIQNLKAEKDEASLKSYEINPIDEVVSAFTRYVSALKDTDEAYFELFKKYGLMEPGNNGPELKRFLHPNSRPSTADKMASNQRRLSMNRRQSASVDRRPTLGGRRTSNALDKPETAVRAGYDAADDEMNLDRSLDDQTASLRGSWNQPTTNSTLPGTADQTKVTHPSSRANDAVHSGSNANYLSSIFAGVNKDNARRRERR